MIVALDADFLTDPAAGVRYARDFAATRSPESNGGDVAPVRDRTDTVVDRRHGRSSSAAGVVAARRSYARQLAHVSASLLPIADTTLDAADKRWLDALVADLDANIGAALIVVGATQPAPLHALGHAMNARARRARHDHRIHRGRQKRPADGASLATLVTAMRAGKVDTLLVMDANPAYDAPVDLDFTNALKAVRHLWHLGLYRDETGVLAEWHLPRAHELEALVRRARIRTAVRA